LMVVAGIVVIGAVVWGNVVNQKRDERSARKLPFAEAAAFGMLEGEMTLRSTGAPLAPRDANAPYPACGLGTCADAKAYRVATDGTVKIVLAGTRQPGLEGKSILLVPAIVQGKLTWTCKSDAAPDLMPVSGEKSFSVFCSMLQEAEAATLRREVGNAKINEAYEKPSLPATPPQ
jgi:hypothetical protein